MKLMVLQNSASNLLIQNATNQVAIRTVMEGLRDFWRVVGGGGTCNKELVPFIGFLQLFTRLSEVTSAMSCTKPHGILCVWRTLRTKEFQNKSGTAKTSTEKCSFLT